MTSTLKALSVIFGAGLGFVGLASVSIAQVTPRPPRLLGARIDTRPLGTPGLYSRAKFSPVDTKAFYRLTRRSSYSGGCGKLNDLQAMNTVGFANVELDDSFGNACGGYHNEIALLFDLGRIKNYSGRVLKATLQITQKPFYSCDWLVVHTSVDQHCYSSGNGQPEPKPRGCFAVEVPRYWPTRALRAGALGFDTLPGNRYELDQSGIFDVTDAVRRQVSGVLGADPGAGLLLKPYLVSHQLSGQDNTKCVSIISKIGLFVTFEIPRAGTPPIVR